MRHACTCYLVTFLDRPPMFECGVVGCGSKTQHFKDTCLKQIRLYLQFLLTPPNSIVNIVGNILVFSLVIIKRVLSISVTK